jgi:CRISPR-associated exonuclease Cas4
MPLLIVFLLLIGFGLLWSARRRLAEAGLPPGRVVYMDTQGLARFDQSLYDPLTDLSGRPDYLVKGNDGMIPVEVKSSRAPARPYSSHVLQLAAYCHLAGVAFGKKPKYGVVKYADRAFAVDYDSVMENELLDVIADMRRAEQREPSRSHDSAQRCRACGFRQICDQVLD